MARRVPGSGLTPPRWMPDVREAVDADAWGMVALIGACWSEYPGCVMDVHGECPELLAPASYFRLVGGTLWVMPEGRWLAACIGLRPGTGDQIELVKLYVARHRRGHGLGRALAEAVEDRAAALGATAIELWSDSRFTAGHRLYRSLGYQATGGMRELHDLSNTTEHHFLKAM